LAHFKTVSGDAYHDASTSSTNAEGGIQSYTLTNHVLEDDDEDIQKKVDQQKIY